MEFSDADQSCKGAAAGRPVIGCNDLLMDMGKPGALGSPEIMAATHHVIDACKAHGKWPGLGGDRHLERQAAFIRGGVRFITTQTDSAFLLAEAGRRTAELRRAAADAPNKPFLPVS